MWGWIVTIAGWVWGGIQATIDATVIALQWAVGALWAFATSVYNGLVAVGTTVFQGFQKAWDFLKLTYEDVLKPAWSKFWTLFDRVGRWLKDTFGPVLRFLNTVRNDILKFYAKWIRPILDIIDATRGVLRVLEALHIEWAQALDNALGSIESWVNEQLQKILGPLNQIIGLVNRVVTADGLFQRVAHIRTLERDVLYASRVFTNARMRALTDDDRYAVTRSAETHSVPDVTADIEKHFASGDADVSPLYDVALDDWRAILEIT